MEHRTLGRTDLQLPILSFGASSLGQEFRPVGLEDALLSVHTALELGMNFIDTSPFYGRGMSEVMLGIALRDVPRDSYLLGTKLGRYAVNHFDFSARRVNESVDISLERLGTDYLDIVLCHDIEFGDLQQIIAETLPALQAEKEKGKVRYIGVSGYPMHIFKTILDQADIDVILSYNHYTLQNTMLEELIPICQQQGIGIMNAAPFSARLLTHAPLPSWHKATPQVREVAAAAGKRAQAAGVDIAQLALQFSLQQTDLSTCIVGSANPQNIRKWAQWAAQPIDHSLLAEVREILQPIHNWFYVEGRPENNDPPQNPLPQE